MIVLRLAVVSALIYVGFAVAIEGWLFVATKVWGSATMLATKTGWFALFGIFWLISFWIAFRLSSFYGLFRDLK